MEIYTDYQAVGVSVILLSYWEFNLEKIQLGLVDKRDFVNCKIMTKYTC